MIQISSNIFSSLKLCQWWNSNRTNPISKCQQRRQWQFCWYLQNRWQIFLPILMPKNLKATYLKNVKQNLSVFTFSSGKFLTGHAFSRTIKSLLHNYLGKANHFCVHSFGSVELFELQTVHICKLCWKVNFQKLLDAIQK